MAPVPHHHPTPAHSTIIHTGRFQHAESGAGGQLEWKGLIRYHTVAWLRGFEWRPRRADGGFHLLWFIGTILGEEEDPSNDEDVDQDILFFDSGSRSQKRFKIPI
jgi:hypothetical protein